MFLILIVLALVLLFVLFAKRPVNMNGLHAAGTVPIDPPAPTRAPQSSAKHPMSSPPPDITSVNFNDVFSAKKTDQPNQ